MNSLFVSLGDKDTPAPSCDGVMSDLLRAACGRLIDSNVFFRSLLVTFEAAQSSDVATLLPMSQVPRLLPVAVAMQLSAHCVDVVVSMSRSCTNS